MRAVLLGAIRIQRERMAAQLEAALLRDLTLALLNLAVVQLNGPF